MHARGESLGESRMRETCTSGSTRGEVRSFFFTRSLSYSTVMGPTRTLRIGQIVAGQPEQAEKLVHIEPRGRAVVPKED